jgi:hypothetical protein
LTDYFKSVFTKHLKEIELIGQSLLGDDLANDRPFIAKLGVNDWEWYAGSYKRAADVLVQSVQEGKEYVDQLVYPVGAMYRQSIELQLKRLYLLVFPDSKLPFHHKLEELWQGVRGLWEQYPKPDYYTVHLISLDKRLAEFMQMDPTSQSFRYPTDKIGEPSFGESSVNLRKMKEIAYAIHIFIDLVATGIEEGSNRSEAR